jgi:hypothetical protein
MDKPLKKSDKPIKPTKPVEPDIFDKKKYPDSSYIYNSSGHRIGGDWFDDTRRYEKDKAKYEKGLFLYEQTKMIEDIKRSTLKKCLDKYSIKQLK